MVRSPFAAAVVAVVSVTVAASTLLVAQQATPPPTPPAKPSPTAKPTPAQTKPATPPAKSGTTAKPAATPTPTPTPTPPPPPKPATDVKLKTQYQNGAQISENVTYLQGPRQRVEFPAVVSIDQCDLKRSVMLNAAEKKYRVQPYPESGASAPAAPVPTPEYAMGGPQGQAKGGVVTMTTTLTDTLERQQMFGLEARHVKSTLVKEPSSRACDKQPLKVEVDAWYVDLPEQQVCLRPAAPPPPPPADPAACTDRVETRTVGDVKLGFPVKATTTTTNGEGDKLEVTTSSQTVTELEITRLDHSLFDVPAGYIEANSTAEVVPAVGNGGLADAVFGSTADGTSMAAPKKPGVVRIGVLEPVNHTDRNLSGRFLRQDVVAKLNKGSFDALPLAGSSPAEIEQEAAKLQCDYILFTDITDAKTSKSGGVGGMLKKASGSGDKDKQEVKLDYKLFAVGATQAPKLSGKAQASTGGFGVGSALKVAAFAGQMYMGVMGMGGLTNSMMGMSGLAGMGGGLGMYDPRASAMASMAASVGMQMAMGGAGGGMGGDASEQDMRNTVSEALGNAAKATMDQLSSPKKK